MTYHAPGVEVISIANQRIINISEEVRIPAIIATGPSIRTVIDEPVVRAAGSGSSNQDFLQHFNVTVSQVAAIPGVSGSYSNWVSNYTYGAGTDVNNLGYIEWTGGTPGDGQPREGETYYVSYTYPVDATQFDPTTFVDSDDIIAFYGNESVAADGSMTMAANLALENGAPAVMCVQVSGSADSNWNTAVNKLRKKKNVAYVIPITVDSTRQAYFVNHCLLESQPLIGHERECILGMSSSSTVDNHITKANALASSRAILVFPGDNVERNDLTLDGSYIAAAVAGAITSQEKVVYPVTGKTLVGFSIPDEAYEPYDMNRLGANGVLVCYSEAGVVKVRHALTTDPTSADTVEVSIIASDDYVRRITRNKLDERFIGKGIVIGPETPGLVEEALKAIWNAMVRDGYIYAYGTKTDPLTGEVPIKAVQSLVDPRQVDVTGSIKFLYPLNWVKVTFYLFV
jgi:hypothetical protein